MKYLMKQGAMVGPECRFYFICLKDFNPISLNCSVERSDSNSELVEV